MSDLVIRYFHFFAIFVLVAMSVSQNILLKRELTARETKRLAVLDAVYGLAAVVTLVAGLLLWLWVGKPSSFYSSNPVFHVKLTLFGLVAILSIAPTVFFFKHLNVRDEYIVVPKSVLRLKRFELIALAVMPALAVTMARGIGAQ